MSEFNFKLRIRKINNCSYPINPKSVIYIMSREQRVNDNYGIKALLLHAKNKNLVPIVIFNLYTDIKLRSQNQILWMIDNLKSIEKILNNLGVQFIVNIIDQINKSDQISKEALKYRPDSIYLDCHVLKGPRNLNENIGQLTNLPVYEVDSRNIVPVWISSTKEEYQASTFRPKIVKLLDKFVVDDFTDDFPNFRNVNNNNDWEKIENIVKKFYPNRIQNLPISGYKTANDVMNEFLNNKIFKYLELKNNPTIQAQSGLSPYLHFGQISSLRVVLNCVSIANKFGMNIDFTDLIKPENKNFSEEKRSVLAFLEEIIVRRELADNFCFYNPNYNNKNCAKDWSKKNIEKHKYDKREYIYGFDQLESARTHDEAWNACQNEMITTGKMHGYMRMYWAKKILEWTPDVESAIEYAIKLNDMYELDGTDSNGYTGIMWSIVGIHDRPWFERPIFGNLRYMSYEGLRRKFDIDKYIHNFC